MSAIAWVTTFERGETTSEATAGAVTMQLHHPMPFLKRWTLAVWARDIDGNSVSVSREYRQRPSDALVQRLVAVVWLAQSAANAAEAAAAEAAAAEGATP